MSRSAVGIGGRLAVACFVLTHAVRSLGAVFPSSVYRHGVAWIVPVPVAAWRGHPRPPAFSPQPHRLAFPVISYRLFAYRSVRRPVSSPRLGVPFPLSCPCVISLVGGERLVHMVFSLSPIRTRRFSQLNFPSVSHCARQGETSERID